MSEVTSGLSVVQTLIKGHYYITHFVHQHGPVESELLWSTFEDSFGRVESAYPQYYGPFDSLEVLAKFCFRICDETNQMQVNILSQDEYNQLLEESPNIHSLKNNIGKLGNIIANPDASSKKGLFGKLFN